jgi:hypothetical protein
MISEFEISMRASQVTTLFVTIILIMKRAVLSDFQRSESTICKAMTVREVRHRNKRKTTIQKVLTPNAWQLYGKEDGQATLFSRVITHIHYYKVVNIHYISLCQSYYSFFKGYHSHSQVNSLYSIS